MMPVWFGPIIDLAVRVGNYVMGRVEKKTEDSDHATDALIDRDRTVLRDGLDKLRDKDRNI
jgi:hypothetical protein